MPVTSDEYADAYNRFRNAYDRYVIVRDANMQGQAASLERLAAFHAYIKAKENYDRIGREYMTQMMPTVTVRASHRARSHIRRIR